MPLFNYQCGSCANVFETLANYQERTTIRCTRCGGASKRQAFSLFHIVGQPKVGRASLSASSADFLSNPDTFVGAMDTFGDKIGDRLSKRQMEKAVEQLKRAKR
jgi:putative FmdB family regulatory protein